LVRSHASVQAGRCERQLAAAAVIDPVSFKNPRRGGVLRRDFSDSLFQNAWHIFILAAPDRPGM
jgi:hypothetical protein